uniref:TLDc domain-containing protein n=1 Tax=Xiphophorus couchianus TaxID=32473 RepID=A0A3B5MKW8_9TELE
TANLDSPALLVVKDMCLGLSAQICSVSKYFYGTGQTFLFSFGPDFQVGGWGNSSSKCIRFLSFRGGFALWLDADLCRGASFSFPTFHNAPLSTHEDFNVLDIEVWTVQGLNGSVKQTRFLL